MMILSDFSVRLKYFYWKLESLFCEYFVRLSRTEAKQNSHLLKYNLVVSLTSYPARFKKLHLTLKSLIRQSVKPDLLILWIAFDDYKYLPASILLLEKRIAWFEIRTCADTRSYKKLIPSLKAFPDSYIVTADDDLFYPRCWLTKLLSSVADDNSVIAHRVHRPTFINKTLNPYVKWQQNCQSQNSNEVLFATGIGGVLYPPNSFNDEVFNQENFSLLCKSADDIWFFWMARLNGVETRWSGYNFNTINWIGTDDTGLATTNVVQGGNDLCIQKMKEYYGDVF